MDTVLKTSEQGYAQAQYDLGNMYHYGIGIEKDTCKAIMWYKKAAEQNYAPALETLRNISK